MSHSAQSNPPDLRTHRCVSTVPYRRFAAWPELPSTEHACKTRAHPRCRYALALCR